MDFTSISSFQIKQEITDLDIRQMKIINIAMILGVLFLLIVTMYLNYFGNNNNTSGTDTGVMNIFLMIIFALMFIGYPLVLSIHKILLSQGRIVQIKKQGIIDAKGNKSENPIEILVVQYRMLMIIKLALLEGIALLGIVFFLTAVFSDLVQQFNIYWFLLVPSLIFFFFVFIFFPTKDKVVFYIEQNILPKFRGQ